MFNPIPEFEDMRLWPPKPGVYIDKYGKRLLVVGVANEWTVGSENFPVHKNGYPPELWVVCQDESNNYKIVPYDDFFTLIDGKPRYLLLKEVRRHALTINDMMGDGNGKDDKDCQEH